MSEEPKISGDLQKIDVKISIDGAEGRNFDALLEIFGRWRLEEGEEIVDLADYLHVPEGPGCLLVSHRWQFGIDFDSGQAGIYFSSRKGLEGSLEARIRSVLHSTLTKGKRLLAEPGLEGLQMNTSSLQISVNDRVRFPNEDGADKVFRTALKSALDAAFGSGNYSLERDSVPGNRLGYHIPCAGGAPSSDELLGRIGGRIGDPARLPKPHLSSFVLAGRMFVF